VTRTTAAVRRARGAIVDHGECRHCGRKDAPVNDYGTLDRHRRADWNRDDPSMINSITFCAGGGSWLKPGESCAKYHDYPGIAEHCHDHKHTTSPTTEK
jgi:hypothetical protein